MKIPPVRLSSGQLLWALSRGREPDDRLRNEVRYLRRLGVPHREDKVGQGRGNRLVYGYEDLVELGVAIHAMRHGAKAADAAKFLIGERAPLRKLFRDALAKFNDDALKDPWVKSRGKRIPLLEHDISLRLHDRYSSKPGTYELIPPSGAAGFADMLGMREVFADGQDRLLVPLTRIAIELLAWALEAPEIRPGRATGS